MLLSFSSADQAKSLVKPELDAYPVRVRLSHSGTPASMSPAPSFSVTEDAINRPLARLGTKPHRLSDAGYAFSSPPITASSSHTALFSMAGSEEGAFLPERTSPEGPVNLRASLTSLLARSRTSSCSGTPDTQPATHFESKPSTAHLPRPRGRQASAPAAGIPRSCAAEVMHAGPSQYYSAKDKVQGHHAPTHNPWHQAGRFILMALAVWSVATAFAFFGAGLLGNHSSSSMPIVMHRSAPHIVGRPHDLSLLGSRVTRFLRSDGSVEEVPVRLLPRAMLSTTTTSLVNDVIPEHGSSPKARLANASALKADLAATQDMLAQEVVAHRVDEASLAALQKLLAESEAALQAMESQLSKCETENTKVRLQVKTLEEQVHQLKKSAKNAAKAA